VELLASSCTVRQRCLGLNVFSFLLKKFAAPGLAASAPSMRRLPLLFSANLLKTLMTNLGQKDKPLHAPALAAVRAHPPI
jgi:hypothetical protein